MPSQGRGRVPGAGGSVPRPARCLIVVCCRETGDLSAHTFRGMVDDARASAGPGGDHALLANALQSSSGLIAYFLKRRGRHSNDGLLSTRALNSFCRWESCW